MLKNKFGYSLKEEHINTVTHVLGLIISIIGSLFIIINTAINHDEWNYIFSKIIVQGNHTQVPKQIGIILTNPI